MSGNAHGGDDTLTGGFQAIINNLFGDANDMNGNASGGNDTLIACVLNGETRTRRSRIRYPIIAD